MSIITFEDIIKVSIPFSNINNKQSVLSIFSQHLRRKPRVRASTTNRAGWRKLHVYRTLYGTYSRRWLNIIRTWNFKVLKEDVYRSTVSSHICGQVYFTHSSEKRIFYHGIGLSCLTRLKQNYALQTVPFRSEANRSGSRILYTNY